MTAKNLRELRRLFIALQQRIAHAKMRSAAVMADAHAIRQRVWRARVGRLGMRHSPERLQNAGV